MQANSVYAAFVSFRFGAPGDPDEAIIAAHQSLLDHLPRLLSGVSLRGRAEQAYFLVFRSEGDLDEYLRSAEVRRFRNSKGCYDLFVQGFDLVATAGAGLNSDLPLAAAIQQLEIHTVLPV